MKKNKSHIFLTWMLMFCFAAGQYMVYSHTHKVNITSNKAAYHSPHTQPKQTVTENCQLCDAMHHNAMEVFSSAYFAPFTISGYYYKAVKHNFISVALILSAGRSPPIA
ncbi:MAG: hypothetical protein ACHQF4_10825 [Sphingobacteriales bacterium]